MDHSKPTLGLQAKLNTGLEQYRQRRRNDYAAVSVLMLLWEDDDLGCIEEVKQLSAIFRETFHYTVRQFLIPTERPQSSLCRVVSDFIYEFGSSGNLVLVYYGGHGDPDLNGDREAVWAALRDGGPTLRWHYIQPSFEAAECDVLIILDCCFAGQAARGRSSHRVEILAAAAMGLRTPSPGQKFPSFTKVFIAELTRIYEEQKSVDIRVLHREMLKKTHQLQQQPIYVALSGEPSNGIILRGITNPVSDRLNGKSLSDETYALNLRVSLFETPNDGHNDQILRWLTTSRPSVVSTISVEKIFELAQGSIALGKAMIEERGPNTGLEAATRIPHLAKSAFLTSFNRLQLVVNEPLRTHMLDDQYITRTMDDIQEACQSFLDTFKDCVSIFEVSTLQDLAYAPETHIESLAERVSLRLRLLDTPSNKAPVNNGRVKFASTSRTEERIRRGRQGGDDVLVEYYYYDPTSTVVEESAAFMLVQVKKIAALHAEPKDDSFSTLLGRGYSHEELHGPRFGLVYQIPLQHESSPYFILSDCFRKFPNVPLETRKCLAYKVSMALCSMHSIGWLHKNFKSRNVLLFGVQSTSDAENCSHKDTASGPTFESPYVFGFDCSRPAAQESTLRTEWDQQINLYRHPDRWGRPQIYTKAHDVYALGILLLEIALWKPIAYLDPEKKGFTTTSDPEKLRLILLELCKSKVPHAMGLHYAKVIETCLTRSLGHDMDEWQFQRHFRKHVVQELV